MAKKIIEALVATEFVPPETLFFVDSFGAYLGGFSGVEPPPGAIQVPFPPDDARQVWSFQSETWGPIPPVTDYTISADVPWARMTEEEAELVQEGVDSSPVKTRNMINKATSFSTGTDAFTKFKAIIATAINPGRADEIMAPPLPSDLAMEIEVGS